MTNYNLQEFKQWLAENPARKENLPEWNIIFKYMGNQFEDFLYDRFFTHVMYKPYHQVAKKWKAEVDTRERERESNTKWGGIH